MQVKKIIAIIFFYSTLLSPSFSQFLDINDGGNIILHSHISPNLLGGGVAIIDFNNDGWEDVYLTGGSESDALLMNKGNLEFEDSSISSFIFQYTRLYHTNSVSTGDINNDGFTDLFIGTIKEESSLLLLNTGKGSFQNITASSGIAPFKEWAMGAVFIDVNNDGYQDIYVINYIEEFNSILDENNEVIGFDHDCAPNRLFINKGDLTFSEEGALYNVDSKGCGLAVLTTDINNDNMQDIFVGNDFGEWVYPNELFVSQPASNSFNELANSYNLSDSIYSMGIGVADINDDSQDDFIVTNIGKSSFKLSDASSSEYEDLNPSGLINNQTGWGALIFDADNDIDSEVYISNGFINTADFIGNDASDSNRFYLNANGSFIESTSAFVIDKNAKSRGSAVCDLNNDGFLDIVNVNIDRTHFDLNSNVNFYINQANQANNWLSLLLETKDLKSPVGATVTAYYQDQAITKRYFSGGSHASSSSKRIHFGLNKVTKIDSMKVQWPDGDKSVFFNISANKHLKIKQSENPTQLDCSSANWGCVHTKPLSSDVISLDFSVYPNPSTGAISIESMLNQPIKIFDSSGRLIALYTIPNGAQKVHATIEKRGIYIIRIGYESKKILIY
ncbi:Por secretion system C-terminal sorting domain-containing protein [Ekhidna lutea]|uniref:Por secretion system C-terminal sorting domain-containing protein n=1 Tax=Ekhidna lutea TaxID=447679 RepID=A0A239KAA7_EKHLU|nr:FG-GAP-like repeat-containing protein [Ekhidna lutea]SNT14583.1 Por secretion system C-terminal sorting domain-containing protein [Ekhidna lutea]